MKKIFFALMVAFTSIGCTSQNTASKDAEHTIKPEKNEDGEWEIFVSDPRYDYFLNAVARPRGMYTESYLKNKNTFLVSEWNSYFTAGRYRDIIESQIEYNPTEKYGLEFEYKLYQVFVFVQWQYRVKFQNLNGMDGGIR